MYLVMLSSMIILAAFHRLRILHQEVLFFHWFQVVIKCISIYPRCFMNLNFIRWSIFGVIVMAMIMNKAYLFLNYVKCYGDNILIFAPHSGKVQRSISY